MLDTMTSWFSVSDALTRVAVMVCVVCVTGRQLGAVQGTLHIPQCSAQGWMDVLEDATPYFKCEGFGAEQTVKWRIVRNNTVVASSTCAPDPAASQIQKCNITSSYIEAHRLNHKHSDLYITYNARELASNGSVDCYVDDKTEDKTTCRTNVISPAVLSGCEVTMTTHQTLAGTCNFNNTYSSNGTYTCTWTLTPTDGQNVSDVIIHGNITKNEQTSNGKLYYKGTCSFTRQIPDGQYTYTVRFFPGKPGHQKQGSVGVTESSSTPKPVQTTGSSKSSSTKQPGPTTGPSKSSSKPQPSTTDSPKLPPTRQPVQTTDSSTSSSIAQPATTDSSDVPLGAVIGGAVAAVVVIAVAVIVVVFIVIRRKRQKEDTGKDRDDDSDFEMHVNSAYVSAGELDQDTLPHQQPSRPSGVALCIPSKNTAFTTTSPAGRPTPSPATANHNTDNDYDYSTVEDEGDDTMDPGGYSSVSLGGAARPSPGGGDRGGGDRERPGLSPTTNANNNPSPALAAADVDYYLGDDGDYSSVDLHDNERPNHRHDNRVDGLGGRGGGRRTVDDEDMIDVGYSEVGDTARNVPEAPGNRGNVSGSGAADNIYAKVDKSSQRRGLQPSASSGGVDDMYAKVDKSSQRRGFQPSASGGGDACDDVGNMYARVNKSAPRLRPAAPEDDFRAELAGPPSTTVAGDDEFSDEYSHLNLAHTGRGGAPAKTPPSATFQPVSLSDLSSFDNYAHLDHELREREDRQALEEMRDESARDVYAQVDKSSNGNNLTPSPPVPASRVYQHPPKPKPAVRPKPAVKPKPGV